MRGREVNFMICDRALDRCFRGKWMKSRDFWVHISASAKQGMERLCKGRRSRFRRVVRLPCLQQAAEAAANHLQNEYLKLLSMLLCFHARDVRSSKVFEGLTGSWLKHLPLLFIIRILQVKTNAMQCNAMQSSAVALADTLKKHCINLIKSANCLPCISPLETSNKVVACTIGTTSLTLPYYE